MRAVEPWILEAWMGPSAATSNNHHLGGNLPFAFRHRGLQCVRKLVYWRLAVQNTREGALS